jgi:acetylornithine/N-succinyldiaminopimelate aminotransferase
LGDPDVNAALLGNYARSDLTFDKGEGAYLTATDGRRYLDFGGGIAVNALGHAHPHLVAALTGQAHKLWHVSNLYRIPDQERLAERLVANSFADRVFFCNSGAEAVETAIKAARRFHFANGAPERFRLITLEGAFHGRTLATVAAGGQAKHLEGFGPKVEGFDQVPRDDLRAIRAAVGPETAGILLEPVQGEGGIWPFPPEFLRGLRSLCEEFGLLLVYDEVQCGMGRTGRLFAHERAGVAPDILATAKAIGGGFPLGACLMTEAVAAGMVPGTHGSTFGGNPLAAAVGNAVLDVMLAPGFLDHVERMSNYLGQQLAGIADHYPSVIEEVRGAGLMIGLKCRVPNTELAAALRERGLLTVGAGDNNIRLLPPLIIDESHIREAMAILDAACAALATAAPVPAK